MNFEFWRDYIAETPYRMNEEWVDLDDITGNNNYDVYNIAHPPKEARRLKRHYTKMIADKINVGRNSLSALKLELSVTIPNDDYDQISPKTFQRIIDTHHLKDYQMTGDAKIDIWGLWHAYLDMRIRSACSNMGIRSTTTGNPHAKARTRKIPMPEIFQPYFPALKGSEEQKKRATKYRNRYLAGLVWYDNHLLTDLLEHLKAGKPIHAPWDKAYFWASLEFCNFQRLTDTLLGKYCYKKLMHRCRFVAQSRVSSAYSQM